jgi:mRNA export factor
LIALSNKQNYLQDGTKIISAGADKAARMYDVATGQSSQIAAHDAPIKSVRYVDQQGGIVATGSWDKTLKVLTILRLNEGIPR